MSARQVWLLLHIFLLYHLKPGNCKVQPLDLMQVATRVSLDRCIISAAKRYFVKRFNTILFSLPIVQSKKDESGPIATDQILLEQLYEERRWSIVMKHFGGRPQGHHVRYYPKSYLIQIRSRKEAKININYLSKFMSWNPHAKFLVVSSEVFHDPEEVALEAFQALFAANTVSIAVMLPDPKNKTNFLVFSWRPQVNRTCSPDHLEALLINTCYFGKIQLKQNWFPDILRLKNQKDYGCDIKVSYFIWPPFVIQDGQNLDGIEINLMKMIEEKLDIVIKFEKSNFSDWGTVHEDGRAEGDMKLLQDDQLDIALGGYMKTIARCSFLDCTRTFFQENFLWCVPHSPLTIGVKAMIDYIGIEVWLCYFGLVLILTVLIWYLSSLITKEIMFFRSINNTVLYSLCVSLGNCCSKLPRSVPVRYFTGLLLFLGLYMNAIYTSNFTSMLADPHYIEQYDSIENIFKYDLKTFYSIKKWVLYDEKDVNSNANLNGIPLRTVDDKWLHSSNTTQSLQDVANGGTALCISEINKNYVFNSIKEMRSMQRKVYCFNDQLNARPINILMRKGFPFMDAIDSLIEQIISSGFVEKWKLDVMKNQGKVELIDVAAAVKSSSVRFENLLPIFILVAIGYTIALGIFAMEMLVHGKGSEHEEVQVDISEDLSIIIGGLNAIIASTLITVVYRKWSCLLTQLIYFKHFGRPTTFDDVAYKGNLVAALYISYVSIGVVLYGIVAIFRASGCRKVAVRTEHRMFCGTYTPIWLPFDMDTRIIYVLQFLFTSFIPIPSAVLCFMFVQVAELIISHLSYLKEHLDLVFEEPNVHLRIAKLTKCVRYHQYILDLGKQLNYLVKYNVGFISSSWALIFGCIANQIAKSMNLGAIIFLCGYMVALFCFSYAGQRLKDESISIGDGLYTLDWYKITAYEQKNVLHMIVRSQYPLILDASPLGNYGYPLFLMIVKTAYSFLTLLHNST